MSHCFCERRVAIGCLYDVVPTPESRALAASWPLAADFAMSASASIPVVDIDGDGKFKYVLLQLTPTGGGGPTVVVRGYAGCAFHADVMAEAVRRAGAGVRAACLGGGRIRHDAAARTLFVYGYSQAFGRGDHALACDLLRARYPDYAAAAISWSNDGY